MNKPTYQLKDEILQYLVAYSNEIDKKTFVLDSNEFEDVFDSSFTTQYFAHLLNEIEINGYIIIRHYGGLEHLITITSLGFDFLRNGGYTKQHAKSLKAEKRQNKEYKLVNWRVRWFWISQVLAVVALALSIYAVFKD